MPAKKPKTKPAHIQELELLNMCVEKIRSEVLENLDEIQSRIIALIPEEHKRPCKMSVKEMLAEFEEAFPD